MSSTLSESLPTDLREQVSESLGAITDFLKQRHKSDVTEAEFRKAHGYAKVGTTVVSAGVRFVSAQNQRDMIELARARMGEAPNQVTGAK